MTRGREGRGGERDREEGGIGRKEGRGTMRDEESEKMKNEKVASLAWLGFVFVITG